MNTQPTPETDKFFATFADGEAAPSHAEYYARLQDLERERDEAYEMIFKMEGGAREMGYELYIMKQERDEAREYADKLAEGLPDGMLPKDVEVLREANLNLATELTAVTEQRDRYKLACDQYSEDEILCKLQTVTAQRDRLAEALQKVSRSWNYVEVAQQALQSLTPKEV
jgi:hypothetical protein